MSLSFYNEIFTWALNTNHHLEINLINPPKKAEAKNSIFVVTKRSCSVYPIQICCYCECGTDVVNFSVWLVSCGWSLVEIVREKLENVRWHSRSLNAFCDVTENSFRSDAEENKARVHRNDHESKTALIALSGFTLSVFIILWALIVLVRFYIFDSILYNIFLLCMLVTGKNLK